jgi:hypothetical protein
LGSVSDDLIVKYKTQCNFTKQANGKTYLTPLSYDMDFDPKLVKIYFGNLFNGNKLLGEISRHHSESLQNGGEGGPLRRNRVRSPTFRDGRPLLWYKFPCISEERTAPIFRVKY